MATETRQHERSENQSQNASRADAQPRRSGNGHDAEPGRSQATARQQRSIPSVMTGLAVDIAALVRGEAELAKAEFSEKITQAVTGLAFVMVSVAVLISGLTILLGAAVVGLSLLLPVWLSALIVGGVVVLIGLGMVMVGRSKLQPKNLTPNRTLDSFDRDSNLVKEQWA